MKYRKQILTLHKILGLATGLVVFLVSITGCCWAFKDEIESLYSDYKTVEVQDTPQITVTEAQTIAQEVFPDNHIHGAIFGKPNQAIQVIFYDREPEFYQDVYLNPYSGEVIQVNDNLSGFFPFILKGHMRLWFPKEFGEQFVGASILLFIFIIISGFLLWIPKQRKNLKQRITFDWKSTTRWKRKNFDLHTVIGFYICSLALILAFTGTVMSYDWLKYVLYKSTGGDKVAAFIIPENNSGLKINDASEGVAPIDQLIPKLWKASPDVDNYELHYPESDTSSIYVEVSKTAGIFYDSDFRFFDQNTLEEIETPGIYGKYEDAKFADKILRMNYDIHIGAIGGIVGKIIAFLVSLLTASLPVTGVLLWYGRNYKNKKELQA
ncbi:PepSY-associated TM helix domain-containing protein [Tamlana sp. 2_MG-2023]|uniref:PepSY-associated TM helix domain-containing protein n=1 Tax=unclassified Tamlana TaxID=2614803 RepID=UPI0026E1FC6C|nr:MULTISPECIES: PepSY-associated TM helix domain-containing protein [unclassified Tamlana]MDO6760769.1 PepSY-associated TM helix domain-containing protein [Tamlana sp. 2_MG-2023]MDO6791025.1 PepSY-associated TM helix domain-containing protein [Tamlana sp. 1_MG-2023]